MALRHEVEGPCVLVARNLLLIGFNPVVQAVGNFLAAIALFGGIAAAIVVFVLFVVWGQEATVEWLGELEDRFWNIADDPVLNFIVNAGVVAVTIWVGFWLFAVTLVLAAVLVVLWLLAQIPVAAAWLVDVSPVGAAISVVIAAWALWQFVLRRLVRNMRSGRSS